MKGYSHGGIYMEDHTYGATHTEGTYTLNKPCTLDVLSCLLNGICLYWIGRARLLDKKSSKQEWGPLAR